VPTSSSTRRILGLSDVRSKTIGIRTVLSASGMPVYKNVRLMLARDWHELVSAMRLLNGYAKSSDETCERSEMSDALTNGGWRLTRWKATFTYERAVPFEGWWPARRKDWADTINDVWSNGDSRSFGFSPED
jgi:hypothetical protein